MGFFDIFKRKEENKPKLEDISDLKKFLEEKSDSCNESQKNAISDIKTKIESVNKTLDKHIEVLENLDLSDKKVEERVKILVKGSLNGFVEHLHRLNEKLKSIALEDGSDLDLFRNKISEQLREFEEKSYMHYERATFLVGDEIANTLKDLNLFSKELDKTISKHGDVIKINLNFREMKNRKIDLKKTKIEKEEIESEIKDAMTRKKEHNESMSKLEKNKKQILESNEYQEIQNMLKNKNELDNKLKLSINKLQIAIDFKELTKILHSSPKEMDILKNYKSNFYDSFSKDMGTEILKLINSTSINNKEELSNKIAEIKELKQKIEKLSNSIPSKDEISQINIDISKEKEKLSELSETIRRLESNLDEKNEEINLLKKDIKKHIKNIVESN